MKKMRPLFFVLICSTVQADECSDGQCVTDDIHLIQREVAFRANTSILKIQETHNGRNGTDTDQPQNQTGSANNGSSSNETTNATTNATVKDCAAMEGDQLAKWWCELENTLVTLNPIDEYIITAFISWIIQMILALLVYSFFFPSEPDLFINPKDPIATFKKDHFGCFKRPSICICALCCPAIQWADSMHLAGLLKAHLAMALFFVCMLLNGFTLMGVTEYGIFTAILIVICRQRLREKLGLEKWTAPNVVLDCCYVFFCTCCAISQEAQVVRYAYQMARQEEKVAKEPRVAYLDATPAPISRIEGSLRSAPVPAYSASLSSSMVATSPPPTTQVITTPLAGGMYTVPRSPRSLPSNVL
jgi:Cys-rich protein (TIGR01571 family)